MILFALAISIGAALFAGLLTAVPLMRADPAPLGWMAASAGGEGRRARRLRAAVVTAQIAMSVVLLVGALLLSRSFVRLLETDLGVTTGRVMSVQINLAMGRTLDNVERVALTRRVIERVAAMPAVEAAGAANGLPPNQTRMSFYFEDEAATLGEPRAHRLTLLNPTAGYFEALGIPLLRGRASSTIWSPNRWRHRDSGRSCSQAWPCSRSAWLRSGWLASWPTRCRGARRSSPFASRSAPEGRRCSHW